MDTADDPDVWIEDKELSLVVHARMAAEPDRLIELLRAPVTQAAAAAGLEVHPGKGVLEVCIPGTDKGTALRELIGDRTGAVIYAGDDVGDVPAVREVNDWSGRTGRPALTVAVSPTGGRPAGRRGLADVTVPDPRSPGRAAAAGHRGRAGLAGAPSAPKHSPHTPGNRRPDGAARPPPVSKARRFQSRT